LILKGKFLLHKNEAAAEFVDKSRLRPSNRRRRRYFNGNSTGVVLRDADFVQFRAESGGGGVLHIFCG
jgi:hypothetical protein